MNYKGKEWTKSELIHELEGRDATITALMIDLNKQSDTIASQRAAVKEYMEELDRKDDELEKMDASLRELQTENADFRNGVAALKQINADHDKALKSMAHDLQQMKLAKDYAESVTASLQQKCDERERELNEAKADCRKLVDTMYNANRRRERVTEAAANMAQALYSLLDSENYRD